MISDWRIVSLLSSNPTARSIMSQRMPWRQPPKQTNSYSKGKMIGTLWKLNGNHISDFTTLSLKSAAKANVGKTASTIMTCGNTK